jgi:hypothetical protein
MIADIQGLPNFMVAIALIGAFGLVVFELVVDYFKGAVMGL